MNLRNAISEDQDLLFGVHAAGLVESSMGEIEREAVLKADPDLTLQLLSLMVFAWQWNVLTGKCDAAVHGVTERVRR